MKQLFIILISLIALSACSEAAQATVEYQLGDIVYTNTFDDPNSWDSFGLLETQFGISEGVYTAISQGGGYIPVSNEHVHGNAVIEVTVEQFSSSENGNYGVLCRSQAAQNSIGYYFLISSNGQYGIRIGEGGRVRVLIPWTDHPAINTGIATNQLRIVCIDDYLAFYINDRFVTEARHDWLEQGNMAFVVNAPEGSEIAVQFDDVTIWEAEVITED